MVMYKIKQLEWEELEVSATDLEKQYEACTPICRFEIEKWASGDWAYRYCFDEYYDDGMSSCRDLEDGKAICEKIWTERIKKCLIKEETL